MIEVDEGLGIWVGSIGGGFVGVEGSGCEEYGVGAVSC